MKFEWDEDKRQKNLEKHGLDFADVEEVFESDTVTIEDNRSYYGEERWITLGTLQGLVVLVVHTEQDETIRVISFRKASKHEQKIYFSQFED